MRALSYTALLLAQACGPRSEAPPIHAATLDPSLPLDHVALGAPIVSARTWASALAPNARGGWNFITQAYELHAETPTEYVVVDLDSGHTTRTYGTPKIYTNANFVVGRELRAGNGRVFFPAALTHVAYYEPSEERVKELGPLIDPLGDDRDFYQGSFGSDGMLYLGTQSNGLPTIVQLDPDRLTSRIVGRVGRDRVGYSYAYDLAIDPPWIYVAVGQKPWELAALNIDTGDMRILATRSDNAWIKLEVRKQGVVAILIDRLRARDEKRDVVWCIDGKAIAAKEPGRRLPFRERNFKLAGVVATPDVDLSRLTPTGTGVGRVVWRPRGARAYKTTTFNVEHTTGVTIESLVALPDGGILGNGAQYHGFFRFDPRTDKIETLPPHQPSGGPRAVVNGLVYISGYPKGVLYVFDPTKPWTSTTALDNLPLDERLRADVNPRFLGNFAAAGAHYPVALTFAEGRLFYAGRREREGVGGGVGSYEPETRRFAGHHDRLEHLEPAGILAVNGRIVYSGTATSGDAALVVYDYELREVERLVVRAGLQSTGELFTTSRPEVIIGLSARDRLLYRYDLRSKTLLHTKTTGLVGSAAQRADGSLWFIEDDRLVRVDPQTLAITPFGSVEQLPREISHLAWQGDDLYMSAGSTLHLLRRVGIATKH
jgi:hypothetical protein